MSVSISGCGLDTDTCGGCTLHCTAPYHGPVQGTAAPATNQSHNPELAPPTCNQFLPPPPAPPAPPPTYLSIISSPRNISMTNIYSRDGASGRTSPAPHLSCVKSCNQPAAFPPSVSHNLSCWKILTPNRFFTPNRLLGI